MLQYLQALRDVMTDGRPRPDRTGTGTRNIFGYQMRFDLSKGFPLLTTKKVHFRSIVHELLWFIAGDTNVKYLQDNGVRIWNEWADENGDLGPVYGKQWRSWPNYRTVRDGLVPRVASDGIVDDHQEPVYDGIDQLADVVAELKKNPYGRRHMVVAWNPADVPHMALPPCHCMFQFFVDDLTVRERMDLYLTGNYGAVKAATVVAELLDEIGVPRRRLSCQMYQRSADIFLGVPFNIASYALLTEMMAQSLGMVAGDYIHTFGDLHLYDNHVEQAELQLTRIPDKLPKLVLNPTVEDLFAFKYEDIEIVDYNPQAAIKAQVAV